MDPKIVFILLLAANYGFGGHPPPPQSPRGHPPEKVEAGASVSASVPAYILEAIPSNNHQMVKELSIYAADICHTVGHVALLTGGKEIDVAIVQPTALLPSPFPKELFVQAQNVQPFVNELYFRVSLDHKFLFEAYKDMIGAKADPWIKKQVELMKSVKEAGIRQTKTLIFNRADYLTNQVEKGGEIGLKQVEVNIGQLGGPGFGQKSSELHEQMLQKVEILHRKKPATMAQGEVPENGAIRKAGTSFYLAWKEFQDPKAVIVFLFDATVIEVNYFEQLQFMQFELEAIAKEKGDYVNVVRLTIPESVERITKDEKTGDLYVDGDRRVALVHMVVGLLSHHWDAKGAWETRFQMETSTAILSPNIRAQLAGTKRIQQLLAQPNVLEKFFHPEEEKEKIQALRATFVRLWGLENEHDPAIKAIIEEAKIRPDNFVLKAQLGGGKGNFFGVKIPPKLNSPERVAYTLMEKIRPIAVKNYMRKQFKPSVKLEASTETIATLENVNSELSFLGIYLGDGDFNDENEDGNAHGEKHSSSHRGRGNVDETKVGKQKPHHHSQNHKLIFNHTDGYAVRSKLSSSDQGGVTEGFGFFDSLLLFPEEKFRNWHLELNVH